MTKEQLRNYRTIKKEQRQIEQRLRTLEKRPESEEEILQPLREFYDSKLKELVDAQLTIEKTIQYLKPTERELVRLRDFDGLLCLPLCVSIIAYPAGFVNTFFKIF